MEEPDQLEEPPMEAADTKRMLPSFPVIHAPLKMNIESPESWRVWKMFFLFGMAQPDLAGARCTSLSAKFSHLVGGIWEAYFSKGCNVKPPGTIPKNPNDSWARKGHNAREQGSSSSERYRAFGGTLHIFFV